MSKLSLIPFPQFSWKEKSNLLSKMDLSHIIPTLEGEMAADGKELLQEPGMLYDPIRKFQGNAKTAKENQPLPKVCSGVAVPAQEGDPGATPRIPPHIQAR